VSVEPARGRVTVHRFCQSTNVLGAGDLVERTIEQVSGAATTPLTECETCCGFGGSTSILRPEMAARVLARKLACVAESGADVLVTDNPGCVLHLRGGVAAAGLDLEVRHLAEHLAGLL
jgi:L-lactate dehydrogenase complex protein LldF